MRARFFLPLLMVLATYSWGQSIDYNNFSGLRSQGEVPEDLRANWLDRYYDADQVRVPSDFDAEDRDLEEFWIYQNHAIDLFLYGGRVAYGDPASLYLKKVADRVLADEEKLRSDIRVYLYRSAISNAFCLADGMIAVSTGLFANLNNEAELAFVIAHEAAHYEKEHLFESLEDSEEEGEGDINDYQSVEGRINRSREQELEADALGLEYFLTSGYDTSAVSSTLKVLYQSYHPFGRSEIKNNPLAFRNSYRLPLWAFQNFNEEVKTDYNYLDLGHTHPNISDRIDSVQKYLSNSSSQTSAALYLVGQAQFEEAKTLCQFETVRLNVLAANYTEALYEINYLEEEFPKNKFLETAKLRCLYGLSAFKTRDRFFQVVPTPGKLPGPIRNLSNSLFQFSRLEMLGVSLKYLKDYERAYGSSSMTEVYKKQLNRMIYAHSDLADPRDLNSEANELDQRTMEFFNSILPSHDKRTGAYMVNLIADHAYLDSVQNHLDEIIEDRPNISFSNYNYLSNNFIFDLDYKDLYILDPIVLVNPYDSDGVDRINSQLVEERLMEKLPALLEKQGIEGRILHSDYLGNNSAETYNLMADIKMLGREAALFQDLGFPTGRAESLAELGIDRPYVLSIRGLIDPGNDYYYFNLLDLRNGKSMVRMVDSEGWALLPRDMVRTTKRNLKNLRKK